MEDINMLLTQRKKTLEKMLCTIDSELKKLPEGRLRITHKHTGNHAVQYYHCKGTADRNGIYLAQSELATAYDLAKKSYLLKLRSGIDKQLMFLRKGFPDLSDKPLQQIFTDLSAERKQLVSPLIPDDDTFIREWQAIKYDPLPFEPGTLIHMTERGDRVRSKSEVILANKFYHMDIPYHYEMPLHIPRQGDYYPDFTLLNKRTREIVYLEHFGRMDDEKYVNRNLKKINTYIKSGIIPGRNLIMTFESSQQALDIKVIDRLIKEYLL